MNWLGSMRMVAALGVGLLAARGCGGSSQAHQDTDRLIDALCEQAAGCGCGMDLADGCDASRRALWDARIGAGRERGLTYDPACVQAQIDDLPRVAGCKGPDLPDGPLCVSFCAPFHGDVPAGGSCEGFDATVSDCAPGLVCAGGTCTEPCLALSGRGLGQRCASDQGQIESCAYGLQCGYPSQACEPSVSQSCENDCWGDLYCDYATGSCRPRAAAGESCDSAPCLAGLVGRYDTLNDCVCQEPGNEGDPCQDLGCRSDLLCDYAADQCIPMPTEGEPCPQGQCAEGLQCDYDASVCRIPPDQSGKPCVQGVCAPALWCDTSGDPTGVCRADQADGEPCSGHGQCASGYCPNGFCHPVPLEGDDCRGALLCAAGLVCNGETCEDAVASGPAVCGWDGW